MTKFLLYLALIGFCLRIPLVGHGQYLRFIENKGQWNSEARFRTETQGVGLYITDHGFVYNCIAGADLERIHDLTDKGMDVSAETIHHHAYTVRFAGGNDKAVFTGSGSHNYYENYIRGNDASQWVAHAEAYDRVKRLDVYTGIDLSIYSREGKVKYDFEIAPAGNPGDITMEYTGVTPQLTSDGHLLIRTSVNEVREEAPYAYQVIHGKEHSVPCFYKLKGQQVSFSLPHGYDKRYSLIIDPALIFSTYSGAQSSSFYSFTTTYDNQGNLYSGGQAWGIGWPVSNGAFQSVFSAGTDLSIIKYDSAGSTRLYATYYGGTGTDLPHAMVTNNAGELFIAGSTSSPDLPVTAGCFDNGLSGTGDIFVAHFDSSGGTLLGATYIGGSSSIQGGEPLASSLGGGTGIISAQFTMSPCELLLDNNQHIWVVSSSNSLDFPVTANAMQPANAGGADGVIFQLRPDCSQLIYSTYYGGNNHDGILNGVFNASGKLAFCGATTSTNLATSVNALHPFYMGSGDGFVAVMDTATHVITNATYLGTSGPDLAARIQVNLNNGRLYILGRTLGNYPISSGTYSMANTDMFIDVLDPPLTASIASTRLGKPQGNAAQAFFPTAFLRDVCGNIYLAGMNTVSNASFSMPLTANAFQNNVSRFWFGALSPGLTALTFGTYLGDLVEDHTHVGIHRFDPHGVIYHSICSTNPSFPITAGSWSPTKQNGILLDMISFKFNFDLLEVLADFELAPGYNDTACAPYTPVFDNLSTGATSYLWNFGDSSMSPLFEPSHNFQDSGLYNITLIAYNEECMLSDTATGTIFVKPTYKPLLNLNDTFICDPLPVTLHAQYSNYVPGTVSYQWEPAGAIISTSNNGQSAVVNPAAGTVFTVTAGTNVSGECTDTAAGIITISLFDYSGMYALPADTSICPGDTVPMRAYGGLSYLWSPDKDISVTDEPFVSSWPEKAMQYQVLITGDSGCRISRTVNINLYPPAKIEAGKDQDIRIGESATLHGYCELPFLWTPPALVHPANSLDPAVTPGQTTTYYLTIISPEGCSFIDSVTVHVTDAVLPNAFSPNGDGLNDVFKLIPFDERVSLKDFSVYNRFGQRVFFTRDINEGWNGYYNGKFADLGTYFYLVHYLIGERTYALKGDVTLIR